jgi:ribonuclease P protein component
LILALSKPNRLKSRHDFTAVYQRGIRRGSANLSLRALRRPISSPLRQGQPTPIAGMPPSVPGRPKIGISISRKVSKRAVVRNRIKRQLRAALRQLMPRIKDAWWIVIGVKVTAVECDYWQILQELEQLLVKAEVLHGN